MNTPRSVLRRRQFIQSGSVLAAGAFATVLAGKRLLRAPGGAGATSALPPLAADPSPLPTASESLSPEELEFIGPPAPAVEDFEPDHPPLAYEDQYADFLSGLGLRHLSPTEIIKPHRGTMRGVANSLPPRQLWKQLAPTLKAADEIRERLGVPLCRITSAYRAPDYNAVIPGAVRNSYHTRNQALDLVYYCSPRKAYAMALKLRAEGFFRGGVGLYPTFIHLDTRGWAATWRNA